jgi:hypothetical protein
MINAKTYRKHKLSKWILMLPLFFSVFAFSGYTGKAQSLQQKELQTELVVTNKSKAAKHTVIFTTTYSYTLATSTLHKTHEQEANYLLTYNCLAQVNFISISKKFQSFYPGIRPFHFQAIHKSPDEETITSILIG